MSDFFGFLGDNLISVGTWAFGLGVSGWIAIKVKGFMEKISDDIVSIVKAKKNGIKDQDLRQAAKYAIRWAAKQMPEAEGSDRMQAAIRMAQDLTPNWLISDDKIEAIIEYEYSEFKKDLSNIE